MTTAAHPPQYHTRPSPAGQVRLANGLTVLAGLYLLISAWIHPAIGGSKANAIIFGIIVAILGAVRYAGMAGPWASWVTAVIGVWMIISPWVYGYAGHAWMWNSILVGLIMLVFGVWSARASSTRPNVSAQP